MSQIEWSTPGKTPRTQLRVVADDKHPLVEITFALLDSEKSIFLDPYVIQDLGQILEFAAAVALGCPAESERAA
jgi:hypothetical protein